MTRTRSGTGGARETRRALRVLFPDTVSLSIFLFSYTTHDSSRDTVSVPCPTTGTWWPRRGCTPSTPVGRGVRRVVGDTVTVTKSTYLSDLPGVGRERYDRLETPPLSCLSPTSGTVPPVGRLSGTHRLPWFDCPSWGLEWCRTGPGPFLLVQVGTLNPDTSTDICSGCHPPKDLHCRLRTSRFILSV